MVNSSSKVYQRSDVRASPPFSAAVEAGGLVFISGQGSTDESGAIISDSFEGEMRRTMENLERVLATAGLTLADVIQVRAYVADDSNLRKYNALYRTYFREPFPVRVTLTNCLPGLEFEIEAVAARP